MSKKVKFILSADIVGEATEAVLLGDFNNWDLNAGIGLKVQKDGTLAATVALEPGSYQYRYYLSDGRWVNDSNAQQYAHNPVFQVDNCVVTVAAEQAAAPKAKKAAKAPDQATADDLSKIEGIGKKIAALLAAADITSFEKLGKTTAKKLREILDAAGSKFKVHDPATWPKQAKLAAAGKWEELKTLQKTLKGGK
jgi:predicted flap endonuclease-1-like 5' DNA nuclease